MQQMTLPTAKASKIIQARGVGFVKLDCPQQRWQYLVGSRDMREQRAREASGGSCWVKGKPVGKRGVGGRRGRGKGGLGEGGGGGVWHKWLGALQHHTCHGAIVSKIAEQYQLITTKESSAQSLWHQSVGNDYTC